MNTIKVVLMGDSGVGKSSIIRRLTHKEIRISELPTVGLDLQFHEVDSIRFHLWDIAGGTTYKSIAAQNYKGAYIVLFIYDVTSRMSFESVTSWIDQTGDTHQLAYLLANKCDLDYLRCVSMQEGIDMASSYQLQYIEVSAASGTAVEELFKQFAKVVTDVPMELQELLEPELWTEKKKKCCC